MSSGRSSRQQHRREAVPLHAERDQRFEELGGIRAIGDEIQIDEDQLARAVLPDVGDDVGHRLLIRLPSPRGGHDTEVTVVDAAARRLEHVRRQKATRR